MLFENLYVGNCRSETKSVFAFSPFRSPILFFGVIAALLLHVVAMHNGFLSDLLATHPVDAWTWCVALAVSATVVPVVELHKWWWNRRNLNSSRETKS